MLGRSRAIKDLLSFSFTIVQLFFVLPPTAASQGLSLAVDMSLQSSANTIPSPPSSQPSPPMNRVGDAPPDPTNHTFYTPFPLPDDIPSISLAIRPLASAVDTYLCHLQSVCEACYFLRACRPIQIILTHPRGGRWDEVDYHVHDSVRCPWRCFHPSTPYGDFSHEAHRSFRDSHFGGDGWSVCTICGQPWDMTDPHERCVFGDSLFKLAFMVWEDRPT